MTSVLLINPNIPDLKLFLSSIKPEHKYIIYKKNETKIDDVLKLFTDNTKYLSFVYHFPGYFEIPFFMNPDETDRKFNNFSNEFIKLLEKCKEKCKDLIVDFLSCNLKNADFFSETLKIEKLLGINIRYSVNETGNKKGDWILESDNTDIKKFYFNDNINKWNYVLTGGVTISDLAKNYSDYFQLVNKTLNLLKNANINQIGIDENTFILLNDFEVFDGNGFSIIYDSLTKNGGLFSMPNIIFPEKIPTIQNLRIVSNGGIQDTIIGTGGGAFIRNNQRFFIVNNCISTGTGSINMLGAGGISGYNSGYTVDNSQFFGNAQILNSNCTLNITSNESGGIVGRLGGNRGNLLIQNCYSTGVISGNNSGGISGSFLGNGGTTGTPFENTGNVKVEGCYSTGIISGNNSGGICGSDCGFSKGNVIINQCYSTGNISGISAGGISGLNTGRTSRYTNISQCYSLGTISGNGSGGIVGKSGALSGVLDISDCYTTGNITGVNAGGICGSFISESNGVCNIRNCYTVGLKPSVSAGGLLGTNANSGLGTTSIYYSYTNGSVYYNANIFPVNEFNLSTNLSLITNQISGSTTWNTSTIWKVPSTNPLDLNRLPRLKGFTEPNSMYYDFKYMTFNRQPDYRLTNPVYIDPTSYTNLSDDQILTLRSYVCDAIFSKITGNRFTTLRENLGFDKQTNSNSYTKKNYVVLKAGNTNTTRYNINTIINTNTGAYINLSQPSSVCFVTINNVGQKIIRSSTNNYTFNNPSPI